VVVVMMVVVVIGDGLGDGLFFFLRGILS